MLTSISVTVIAAFIVLFVSFLLPLLVQLRRTAKEGEKLLETARGQIVPLSHDVIKLVDDLQDLVDQGKRQMGKVDESISALRDTAVKLRDVETLFKDRVEEPLHNLIALLAALVKGTRAFLEYIKREKQTTEDPKK
jgi:uncharacterized protein YoxC